jgi:hypothetical protein
MGRREGTVRLATLDVSKPEGQGRHGFTISITSYSTSTEPNYHEHDGVKYKQYVPAHEFGHVIGLDHPGKRVPGKPFAREEYTADAPSVMGLGMEMRMHYYQLWLDDLKKTHSVDGPFTLQSK